MRTTLALFVAAVLLVPAVADARRAATSSERAAIAKKVGVPASCATVYVASSNKHWASYQFTSTKSSCQKYGSNGVTIFHHFDGKWRSVFSGSDISCPVAHVPASIVKDLKIHCTG